MFNDKQFLLWSTVFIAFFLYPDDSDDCLSFHMMSITDIDVFNCL